MKERRRKRIMFESTNVLLSGLFETPDRKVVSGFFDIWKPL